MPWRLPSRYGDQRILARGIARRGGQWSARFSFGARGIRLGSRVMLRLERVSIGVVGLDDFLDKRMTNDVRPAERVEINALDAGEDVTDFEQAALFCPRQIDLRDVTRDHHAGVFP